MPRKKVLIAPLDWGLGHATRCIPVIRELLKSGHEVVIAADGSIKLLLQEEFPQLRFVHLSGYGLAYSSWMPAWLKILFLVPQIIMAAFGEHRWLKKTIRMLRPDVVISDNRFGLWNKSVCTVYITHQVMIKCPAWLKIFEPVLYFIHRAIIRRYNFCWIPDYPGTSNLSGDLSHRYPLPANAAFISPLSRFAHTNENPPVEYDACIILSGPEPARSAFEKIIRKQLQSYSGRTVFVLGKPGSGGDVIAGHSRIASHMPAADLLKIIRASRLVICRSGYSSVMDLHALRKQAVLIPTPGQTEQEYLAGYLSSQKIFRTSSQSRFNIADEVGQEEGPVEFPETGREGSLLAAAISRLMDCARNKPA